MNKVIALDVGNVCCSIHFDRIFGPAGVLPDQQFQKTCALLETGKITEQEFLKDFARLTKHRFSDEFLVEIWNRCIGDVIPGMEEAVRLALRKGFAVAFFSNTSRLHIVEFFRKSPLAHLAIGGVFSYEAGFAKPEERIYRIFEERYGKPEVYFDDRPDNIQGGLRAGWNAVQFGSVKDFQTFLDSCS